MTCVSIPIDVRRLRSACCRVSELVFAPTGRLGEAIAKPQAAFLSNVVFEGHDFRTPLYATSADKVFALRVKLSGTPSIIDRTPGK